MIELCGISNLWNYELTNYLNAPWKFPNVLVSASWFCVCRCFILDVLFLKPLSSMLPDVTVTLSAWCSFTSKLNFSNNKKENFETRLWNYSSINPFQANVFLPPENVSMGYRNEILTWNGLIWMGKNDHFSFSLRNELLL